jgi:hypothetical protein
VNTGALAECIDRVMVRCCEVVTGLHRSPDRTAAPQRAKCGQT